LHTTNKQIVSDSKSLVNRLFRTYFLHSKVEAEDNVLDPQVEGSTGGKVEHFTELHRRSIIDLDAARHEADDAASGSGLKVSRADLVGDGELFQTFVFFGLQAIS